MLNQSILFLRITIFASLLIFRIAKISYSKLWTANIYLPLWRYSKCIANEAKNVFDVVLLIIISKRLWVLFFSKKHSCKWIKTYWKAKRANINYYWLTDKAKHLQSTLFFIYKFLFSYFSFDDKYKGNEYVANEFTSTSINRLNSHIYLISTEMWDSWKPK